VKRIAALIAIAMLAAACNGHGDISNSAVLDFGDVNAFHNHDVDGSEIAHTTRAEAWTWVQDKPSINIRLRTCLTYVLSDTNTGEQVGDFLPGCTSWRWTNDVPNSVWDQNKGWTQLVKTQTLADIANAQGISRYGKTLNAYESWVEIQTSTGSWTCQYHDPDESNNLGICDYPKDAAGN
jgi:hypothetical protein